MNANDKRSISMSLKPKVRGNTSSKFKGVSFCKTKKSKKWRAYIKIDRKLVQLGYFQHEEAAALAYDKAAESAFGDKAILNIGAPNSSPETTVTQLEGALSNGPA